MPEAIKRVIEGVLALFVVGFFSASASAVPIVICTQTNDGTTAGDGANGLQQGGCVASIPTAVPTILLASDGEVPFDPFHFGQPTSDGIQLNADWAPDPAFADAFAPGFWTQIPGTFTWVLPSITPCGADIPGVPLACEPVAKWFFKPGSPWNVGTPDDLLMLEPNGTISDEILVNNTGPNGSAAITFASDPIRVPEPATLSLLALGLACGARRLRRRSA